MPALNTRMTRQSRRRKPKLTDLLMKPS